MTAPLLVMLAGPNGAGRTTFHEARLSQLGLPFLNADVLALETGIDACEAAKSIAAIRDEFIAKGIGFVTETARGDSLNANVKGVAVAGPADSPTTWPSRNSATSSPTPYLCDKHQPGKAVVTSTRGFSIILP